MILSDIPAQQISSLIVLYVSFRFTDFRMKSYIHDFEQKLSALRLHAFYCVVFW